MNNASLSAAQSKKVRPRSPNNVLRINTKDLDRLCEVVKFFVKPRADTRCKASDLAKQSLTFFGFIQEGKKNTKDIFDEYYPPLLGTLLRYFELTSETPTFPSKELDKITIKSEEDKKLFILLATLYNLCLAEKQKTPNAEMEALALGDATCLKDKLPQPEQARDPI